MPACSLARSAPDSESEVGKEGRKEGKGASKEEGKEEKEGDGGGGGENRFAYRYDSESR